MSKIKTPRQFDLETFSGGKLRKRLGLYEFAEAYHKYAVKSELERWKAEKVKELEKKNPYKEDIPHLGILTQHHRGKYIGFMEAIEILKQ